ncbi:MAG: hypothetical protein ACKVTZ_08870 [Bacteroidia bacterium]
MSWTENKWLKPAWMGGENDFVTKYQDKFAKIGEKFAPKIVEKTGIAKAKGNKESRIALTGTESNILGFIIVLNDISQNNIYYSNGGYLEMVIDDHNDYKLFDDFMYEFIYGGGSKQQTIVLRIVKQIVAVFDSFSSGQVCLNDFQNTKDHKDTKLSGGYRIFRSLSIIHFIEERLQTENYEAAKQEDKDKSIFKISHKKAIEKEVAFLKLLFPSLSSVSRVDNLEDDDHDPYKEKYYYYGNFLEVKFTQKKGATTRVFAVNFKSVPE